MPDITPSIHGVLSYGLLLSVMYRSFIRHEASWDLLALVILGGAVSALYQGSFRVLSRRWLMLSAAAALVAAVLAIIIVPGRSSFGG
jgi:uncharacterized protein YejL (UPF0352 family)